MLTPKPDGKAKTFVSCTWSEEGQWNVLCGRHSSMERCSAVAEPEGCLEGAARPPSNLLSEVNASLRLVSCHPAVVLLHLTIWSSPCAPSTFSNHDADTIWCLLRLLSSQRQPSQSLRAFMQLFERQADGVGTKFSELGGDRDAVRDACNRVCGTG